MELELKKHHFDTYETAAELTLTQEESAETIVPDYCPDIARIIGTEGCVCVHSRDLKEGRGTVSGTVRVTVLYVPEGEGGIRPLHFSMPFTAESEGKTLAECSHFTALAETETLETRILNPRKVFTHCKLVMRLTGYRRVQLTVCSDAAAAPELSVEKRQERQTAILLSHISEKDFTFSEDTSLPANRSGAAEILHSSITCSAAEGKIVGSKLIFKGSFLLHLLYRTQDGTYGSHYGELPFSQIMEADGVSENASAQMRLQLTGSDVQIDGGDPEGRDFSVTLYVHATALLRQEQELTLLHDLYSTNHELTYDAEPMSFTAFYDSLVRRQAVREVLEIGVEASSILSVRASCGPVSVAAEGSGTMLRTFVTVRALYLDEGGTPLITERTMEVSCPADLSPECRAAVRAVCSSEIQAVLTDRGIEVRFSVDFHVEESRLSKKLCIRSVRIDTDTIRDSSGTPSLVLRYFGAGNSFWDLAKRYNTTIDTILRANQLETEADVSSEKLLLIPRKRA